MRVLITRSEIDAQETASELCARGHIQVSVPLLTIQHDAQAAETLEQALKGAQGIVFTSANGVRAFAALNGRRDMPAYAVGSASASCARDAGLKAVFSGEGDATSLQALVARACESAAGPLVHVAGTHLASQGGESLKSGLESLGFNVRRVVIYEAEAAKSLPAALRKSLLDQSSLKLDAALFYSPRSAALFRDLVIQADLAGQCEGLRAFCLSTAVARALTPLVFRSVDVAPMPNGQALLDLLD